jgi:hypothetical protein
MPRYTRGPCAADVRIYEWRNGLQKCGARVWRWSSTTALSATLWGRDRARPAVSSIVLVIAIVKVGRPRLTAGMVSSLAADPAS